MDLLNVFYHDRMVADSRGYSPSASKPKKVVSDWIGLGLPVSIRTFKPIAPTDLLTAHHPAFIRGILSGEIENGHDNRFIDIAHACMWTGGSMCYAAMDASSGKGQVACSPSSGFHHAGYDSCHGFCTFNSLIVAAVMVAKERSIRVGILDMDYHYGDGTEDIIERLKLDIPHRTGMGKECIDRDFVRATIKEMDVGLILYQAGADQHIDDPLGGLFTDEQLYQRDLIVFEACKELGVSVAWNLAGGYQRDEGGGIEPVLRIHRSTFCACMLVHGKL